MNKNIYQSPPTIEQRNFRRRFAAGVAGLALSATSLAGMAEAAPLPPETLNIPSDVDLHTETPKTPQHQDSLERAGAKPNIIFFLTDDMDESLLRYMPNTQKYIFNQGARFDNYFTNISLCCPARASILTGKYTHNTGVEGNQYPDGFHGFHTQDEATRTFAVWLKNSGYHTSLMGKYFNEYPFVESSPSHGVRKTFVPNGWSDWAVPIQGQYEGVNYLLNKNGKLEHKSGSRNYLGDVMARRTIAKIRNNDDDKGLMVELSFYGPHTPGPASPIEKNNARLNRKIQKIQYPRTPAFNERDVSDKPKHIKKLKPLSRAKIRTIDAEYRKRILSVKSIDRHIGMVHKALKETGQLDNTYLIFTSDNGYYMGDHRMNIGKNTPYDHDIKLPLGISGPGIEAGTRVSELAVNVDIAPTIADIANVAIRTSIDGESLLPLAQGETVSTWRQHMLVQRGLITAYAKVGAPGEPGVPGQSKFEGSIAGYVASVSNRYRYIVYQNGGRELYDTEIDPYQVENLLATPLENRSESVRMIHAEMQLALESLRGCRGSEDCRQ